MSSTFITPSTSVVLVDTANVSSARLVYFPYISTFGRLITVRDNDGYASTGNTIVLSTISSAIFDDGSSRITINQPFGFVTLTTKQNGRYAVLNTFAFPAGSASAYVSNLTTSNLNTRQIQFTDIANNSNGIMYMSNSGIWFQSTPIGQVTLSNLTSTVNGLGTTGYLSSLTPLVVYPSKLVAVGTSPTAPTGTIQLSENGATSFTNSIGGTGGFSNSAADVAYYNGLYVAVGNNGASNLGQNQWSIDGMSWSNSTGPYLDSNQERTRVIYAAGLWHSIGYSPNGGASTILWSTDGKGWQPSQGTPFSSTGPSYGYATGICQGAGLWVCSGSQNNTSQAGSLLWSSNGSNWNNATGISWSGQTIYDVAYDGTTRFIAYVQSGYGSSSSNLVMSSNGKSWTNGSMTGGNLNNAGGYIAANGSIWLVASHSNAGLGNILKYSIDGGFTWQSNTSFSNTVANLKRPYWDGARWWMGVESASLGSAIYYSGNGIQWVQSGAGFTGGAYPKGFVGVGYNSNLTLELISTVESFSKSISTGSASISSLLLIGEQIPNTFINTSLISTQNAAFNTVLTNNVSTNYLSAGQSFINELNVSTISSAYAFTSLGHFDVINTDYLSATYITASTLFINQVIVSTTINNVAVVSTISTNYAEIDTVSADELQVSSIRPYKGYYGLNIYNDIIMQSTFGIFTSSLSTHFLSAGQSYVDNLAARGISTTLVSASQGYISSLESYTTSTTFLSVGQSYIDNLAARGISTTLVSASQGQISTLRTYNLSTNFLSVGQSYVDNLAARGFSTTLVSASQGYISSLGSYNTSTNFLSVGQSYIDNLAARGISTTLVSASIGQISTLRTYNLSTNFLSAGQTYIDNLAARGISTTLVSASQGQISTLRTYNLSTNFLSAGQTHIDNLAARGISTTLVSVAQGQISTLRTYNLSTNFLSAGQTYIDTLYADGISSLTISTGIVQTSILSTSILTTTSTVTIGTSESKLWVAVGQGTSPLNTIQYSTDSKNWQNIVKGGFVSTFTTPRYIGQGVAYNGSYWLALGQDQNILSSIQRSIDGSNWTGINSGGFPTPNNTSAGSYGGIKAKWNGSYWVAVGYGNNAASTIQKSTDGLNWVGAVSGGFPNRGNDVEWNGSYWVAVGFHTTTQLGSIQISTDGENWGNIASGGFSNQTNVYAGQSISWNGSYWIATGNNTGNTTGTSNIQISYNGSNWVGISTPYPTLNPFNNPVNTATWNGSYWLAGTVSGSPANTQSTILKSTDGYNWFRPLASGQGFAGQVNRLLWNGDFWTAVGHDNNTTSSIKISTDGGSNWTSATTGGFNSVNSGGIDITYNTTLTTPATNVNNEFNINISRTTYYTSDNQLVPVITSTNMFSVKQDGIYTNADVQINGFTVANDFYWNLQRSVGFSKYIPIGWLTNGGVGTNSANLDEPLYFTGKGIYRNATQPQSADGYILGPRVATKIIDIYGNVLADTSNTSYTLPTQAVALAGIDVCGIYSAWFI